jgi:hypothetical protein
MVRRRCHRSPCGRQSRPVVALWTAFALPVALAGRRTTWRILGGFGGVGPPPESPAGDGRGNSRRPRKTFFHCPVRFRMPHLPTSRIPGGHALLSWATDGSV